MSSIARLSIQPRACVSVEMTVWFRFCPPGVGPAVQQRRSDAALHADVRAGPADHPQLLRLQRHLPLPGRRECPLPS